MVVRDGTWPLVGTWGERHNFTWSELPDTWPGSLASVLQPPELEQLWRCFNEEPAETVGPRLAHGDFDVTQIFQSGDAYSGLIDFGEIRGTPPTFDLGHFLLHDTETAQWPLMNDILAGYATVNPGPAGDREAIRRAALQIGTRQLARWLNRIDPSTAARVPLVQTRLEQLRGLLPA